MIQSQLMILYNTRVPPADLEKYQKNFSSHQIFERNKSPGYPINAWFKHSPDEGCEQPFRLSKSQGF